MRDLEHPISCQYRNIDNWCAGKGDLQHAFPLNILMVPTLKLSFIANNNNPTSIDLAPGSAIHFASLEFITDHLGRLSLSPQEWDSSTLFIGMVHSGSPTLRTALEESFDKDDIASGVFGGPTTSSCTTVRPILAFG
jgi:hypothetical protein